MVLIHHKVWKMQKAFDSTFFDLVFQSCCNYWSGSSSTKVFQWDTRYTAKTVECWTWHIKFRVWCKSKLIYTCRCTAHLTETQWKSKCILKNSIPQYIIWYYSTCSTAYMEYILKRWLPHDTQLKWAYLQSVTNNQLLCRLQMLSRGLRWPQL